MRDYGQIPSKWNRLLPSPECSGEFLAHPFSYSMDLGVSFPRITPLPRHEAHHLSPSSTAATPTLHMPS